MVLTLCIGLCIDQKLDFLEYIYMKFHRSETISDVMNDEHIPVFIDQTETHFDILCKGPNSDQATIL